MEKMSKHKLSVDELKDIIVDLRVENVNLSIPVGNCPYAYYEMKREVETCEDASCSKCRRDFLSKMREKIAKEVADL